MPVSMLRKSTIRLILVSIAVAALPSFAAWTKDGEATVRFKATGPAGFKIVGATKSVDITDDGKALTVTVKLGTLDTDNSLRDRHMLEDLEAAKFPLCSLSVPLEALKEDGAETVGKGTFSLHGVTRELPFKYTAKCHDGVCDVDGSAELDLKAFAVKIRSYLGITVKPEVSVTAKFQVKK